VGFLALVGGVSVLVALGANTPVFPVLYRYVPSFNLFQAPARFNLWLVFALALLAAIGADRWQPLAGRGLYWTRLGAMAAATLLVAGTAGVAVIRPATATEAQMETLARGLGMAGAWLLAAALLLLFHHRLPPRLREGVAVLMVAADLMAASAGLNPGGPPAAYRAPAATAAALSAALDGHRLLYFPDEEYGVKYERWLSFEQFGPPETALELRAAQVPNVGVLDGLASANNFDPLVSARYAGLMHVVSETRAVRLLWLMDVAVVASRTPMAGWERVAEAGEVGFYRVPGAPRRVWTVYRAETAPEAEAALRAVAAPDFDPAERVVLEAGDSAPVDTRSLTPTANAVTIAADLQQPGWVVLADTYYPGWSVTVDGQPRPLLRANYAFRAVAVPAGSHSVVFDYRPLSFQRGGQISFVGLLLWTGLGAAALARRRRAMMAYGA
jgi:hypothetical protein